MAGREALWASGHDESVEVNQRALIDKVLARYSGEFTVFRELLQNSDDAQSTAVEIHFQTQNFLDKAQVQGLPDIKTALVHQWIFKNNGIVFRDEDWNRLKKIAEGNPDEEKIGAFGVGFYSLFSVTEEPFVTSGGQWMGFYWKDKKDQLFARRGELPDKDPARDAWTSFEMALREDTPMPNAFDFTRFLASSITFMTHLREVSVYFDDKRLVYLTKTTGALKALVFPSGLNNKSSLGYMMVKGLKSTPLRIQAEVMHWVYSSGSEKAPKPSALQKIANVPTNSGFFSSLFSSLSGASTPARAPTPLPPPPIKQADPLTVHETSVSLSIYSADVDVRLDRKIAAELHRSTKKNPPNKLKYELIYTAKDEYDASKQEDEQIKGTGSIFQGLRADLDGTGAARVFIGHATGQTTGLGGHMATRFIPTVERESIDLMDRNVAIWNKELLYVGGLLARAAYELEMQTISDLWKAGTTTDELKTWLSSRAIHALKFFTFHTSTPSADVSTLMEAAFFASSKSHYFPILSSVGVRNASTVHLPNATFAKFLKQLPVVPEAVMTEAKLMMNALQVRNLIKKMSFEDILNELRARPLPEDEMLACLSWWIDHYKQRSDTTSDIHVIRRELLEAAILLIGQPGGATERIIPLGMIKTFVHTRGSSAVIPTNGPLPDHVLPLSVAKSFSLDDLTSALPWKELSVLDWLKHLCSPAAQADAEFDLTLSAPWAEKVLGVLARSWSGLSTQAKGEIVELLKSRACIPTSAGLKIPAEAYFPNVNIFNDLPVVVFPSGSSSKSTMEKLMDALGVRRHVDLQLIFSRMIKTNEWTVHDLIKYLASVKSSLSEAEINRLTMTSTFAKESTGEVVPGDEKAPRYRANQLYEPSPILRELGLPIIDWGTQHKWRANSEEAKFLFGLGLLRAPPLDVLIGLCAGSDAQLRGKGLKYLVNNMNIKYQAYNPADFTETAFIPAIQDGKSCLAKPNEVFSDSRWASMSFMIAAPSLTADELSKLKIRAHPPTSVLVRLLQQAPPTDVAQASQWFHSLSTQLPQFSKSELAQLAQTKMVPNPVRSASSEKTTSATLLPPVQCFLGGTLKANFHSKLFVFVDFGTNGNAFLAACGSKQEPSVDQVAQMLLQDPHNFYELAGGPTSFLNELRNIAHNSGQIGSGTLARMRKSPILLGSQRKNIAKDKVNPEKGANDLDDEWDLQYDLKRPDEIVIADDTIAHQFFGDSLFAAPQEDVLEGFYFLLGSRRLSSVIKEEHKTSLEVKPSKLSNEMRALILERLPLFLHEHTHAKTRVSYSWLNVDGNFVVKTFGKIVMTKSLTFGALRLQKTQEASAVAKRFGYGPIELWLGGNAQVDMYEVATSLNRLIFESPKTNDALLFMTILSTDLRSLKRRGYNVDRILRQQKTAREAEAAQQAQALAENKALLSSREQAPPAQPKVPITQAPPPQVPQQQEIEQAITRDKPEPERSWRPNGLKATSQALDNLKQFVRGASSNRNSVSEHEPLVRPDQPVVSSSGKSPHATPRSNIAANINQAIQACRPEAGNLLQNREEMKQVRESLNEGYCDVSGRIGDLVHIGEVSGIKVYASQEVQAPQTLINRKQQSLGRFTPIITILAQVYNLPLRSLHIWFDDEGTTIAFNRNGSLFLNLRFWESWHDAAVQKGQSSEALISWFFTIAHEIAHNLVQPHNSEHEFYFSAICEKHLGDLARALGTPLPP